MLWNFPTASKRCPLQILDYLFAMLQHEGTTVQCIRVDEDGALANSSEFCDFLVQRHISLETTGGYASFLNGKIERHHRTIAQMVRSMILKISCTRLLLRIPRLQWMILLDIQMMLVKKLLLQLLHHQVTCCPHQMILLRIFTIKKQNKNVEELVSIQMIYLY